jgi:hypothetical protein
MFSSSRSSLQIVRNALTFNSEELTTAPELLEICIFWGFPYFKLYTRKLFHNSEGSKKPEQFRAS